MAKIRKSKYKGCGMCKAHKKGWAHRFTDPENERRDEAAREIKERTKRQNA